MPKLEFHPSDPFPLLPADSYTLAEAQLHAEAADAWIGLQPDSVEKRISIEPNASVQNWAGLPVRSLLTPYVELRSVLHDVSPTPGQLVVDLGAGYGRMAWVIGEHYPDISFIGYEMVRSRVLESQRCLALKNYPRVSMVHEDLSRPGFVPAPADIFFMYDFGSREAIQKSLIDLKAIARAKPITVVGRGRSSRDAIERDHPWLSGVILPKHTRNYSIYRSA